MRIPVDRQNRLPLYKQIENYFRQAILSGGLTPETRLPATRQLAKDLGVNRITVERAYNELETDGLIYSKIGSGTYVLDSAPILPLPQNDPSEPWPLWQQSLATQGNYPILTPIEALTTHQTPQVINFAGGVGDAHLFPAEDFRKVIQYVLRRDGITSLDYGERRGFAPLRNTIAHILTTQGLQTNPDNILITAGSQQALSLVSQLLLHPGDVVLVENPTYSIALNLFRNLNLQIVGIPVDQNGMVVENLEALLQRHHPKLIYTIPNFQNPTGTCLNGERRRQLITLADRYNVPILEDDFVGDLRYEGRAQPALKALDPGGRVIYISTFSKMLMPGLRVGFIVTEGPIYERLIEFKYVTDLATSELIQRSLETYVTVGRYQTHLRRTCQAYRKRRDTMLLAIHRYLPAEVTLNVPQGGLFLWLRLPTTLSSKNLLKTALKEGVNFAPGTNFFLNHADGEGFLRLNFVVYPPETIFEGIHRLGKAMEK